MHPAAHRGLRELIAAGKLIVHRWPRLADHVPGAAEPLRAGARDAEAMVDAFAALAAARDVAVGGGVTGLGATLGTGMARVGDPFLERNQALRTAVLDVHHTTVLLHYLERVARAVDDGELAQACHDWGHRLIPTEGALRDIAVGTGEDPDAAVAPADGSPVGRVAHGAHVAVGAAGEWLDRRLG